MLEHSPHFTANEAAQIAADFYGIEAAPISLPSERDQNFLINTASGNFVLKIANALEDTHLLEAQNAILRFLETKSRLCQKLIKTTSQRDMTSVKDPATGLSYQVRLVTYIEGKPLAGITHSRGLLRDVGRKLGQLDNFLLEFDHPAVHRDFYWDLRNGLRTVRQLAALISDPKLRETVIRCAEHFDTFISAILCELRQSVIHGDANDYNLIVRSELDHDVLNGVIDFGDVVYSYTVADLAIALAYLMLNSHQPLEAATEVVAAYDEELALTEAELSSLFDLARMRLCMSACLAAKQLKERPDNEYLNVSQRRITEVLPVLAGIDSSSATLLFRSACGNATAVTSK